MLPGGSAKFLVIVVVIIAPVWMPPGTSFNRALQQPRTTTNTTYDIVKAMATEEAADPKSVIIVRPVFKTGVTSDGRKWLAYDLGEIVVDYMGLPPDDPYRLPYVMQLQIEALRREFEQRARALSFWRQPLNAAEQTARATVADVDTLKSSAELGKQLTKRRQEYQVRLGALENSIKNYARTTATIVGEPGHVGPVGFGAEDQYAVQIITEPAGGRVRVVTAFVWRDCQKRSCVPSQLLWRTLNAAQENMIGGYHYVAEWADGRRDEGDFRVDSDSQRTFRPAHR